MARHPESRAQSDEIIAILTCAPSWHGPAANEKPLRLEAGRLAGEANPQHRRPFQAILAPKGPPKLEFDWRADPPLIDVALTPVTATRNWRLRLQSDQAATLPI
jgi:hypothetical protein